jgi:hypothetical protein
MKAKPEEMKSVVEHLKVPNKEGVVEMIAALKEHYGDQHLATGHC